MWFHIGWENFVAKITRSDDSCEIFISDFIRLWHKTLSNDEILSISQKLNPLFEAPAQKLKDLALNFLKDAGAKKEIKEEDNNNIMVKLESSVMTIKYRFHVVLPRGDEEVFYKEFTLPLLLEVIKYQNREKKLLEIIKCKDNEIKEYKQGYGTTSNHVTTKPFSKKDFYSGESTADMPWDNSFLNCINSKLVPTNNKSESKQGVSQLEEKSQRMHCISDTFKKNSTFKDKNLNQNSGSAPNVLLDNKVVKKRKTRNGGFKIKL